MTEQQNPGEAGGHPGENPRRLSTGSATAEFTYTNPVESFVGTVRDLVTRPVDFFRGIVRRGDFVNPLIFALVGAVISAAIGGFLGVLYATVGIGGTGVWGAIGALVASMFFTPIISAIALFICAGILHFLVALVVKPANAGFEATFRVVSYSNVVQLVGWVPILVNSILPFRRLPEAFSEPGGYLDIGVRLNISRAGGTGASPPSLLERADERTRTAYPCSSYEFACAHTSPYWCVRKLPCLSGFR
jgi:hypothetical protein